MHVLDQARVLAGEVPPGRPDGEHHGQPGPVPPGLAQVGDGQAAARRLVERTQRGVPDQDGGIRLQQHLRQFGRAGEVLRCHAVPLGEQHLREQHAGPRSGAERDRPAVQLGERPGGDQVHGEHRTVAAHREVRQQQQVVGVPQVLHQRDRADVEVTVDQCGVEPVGGVLAQVDVDQGAGTHQPPVDRQAVEELDVPDPGAVHRPRHDSHRSRRGRPRHRRPAQLCPTPPPSPPAHTRMSTPGSNCGPGAGRPAAAVPPGMAEMWR